MIDATCIPDNHQLRREAIANINTVFMNAKLMLVCDKDIMKLDASNLNTSTCETLLITIAVSDWNCRTWTFLEAFRARRNIHLLCQNNVVVLLRDLIEIVYQYGMLELNMVFLAMPHFLPPFDGSILAKNKSGVGRPTWQAGHLNLETSSSLLSYRPASRSGDDVVIWSLLMHENIVYYDAKTFWKAMQASIFQCSEETGEIVHYGAGIQTGYLVSSAPRLKIRGLR